MPALHLLHLDSTSSQAVREVDDPYQMHRTLSRLAWNTSMSHEERAKRLERARILFRCEPRDLRVWVMCQTRPRFERLPEGYLAATPLTWTLADFPIAGDELVFRLKARPARRSGSSIAYLQSQGEALDWLGEKGEDKGFAVLESHCESFDWLDSKDGAMVHRSGFEFWGRLRVLDPILFARAMLEGVGRDKAVGFGLLLVFRMVPWGAPDLEALRSRPHISWNERIRRERKELGLAGIPEEGG